MRNSNMPAMPLTEEQIDRSERANGYEGLTKREYFAAKALQGICSNPEYSPQNQLHYDNVAEDAIRQADAFLKKLEESK